MSTKPHFVTTVASVAVFMISVIASLLLPGPVFSQEPNAAFILSQTFDDPTITDTDQFGISVAKGGG